MKKIKYTILFAIIFVIFAFSTVSFASVDLYVPEKTEEYQKWESLSPEEKAKVIQPSYFSISIKDSIRRSKYNQYLLGNTVLESVYDLSKTYKPIVKDQKRTGACWAFAMTSALENSIAVQKSVLGQEYAPYHMEYVTSQMYERTLGYGGNYLLATAYMVNGYGPVLESDFPMESVYDEENNLPANYYLTDIEKVDLNKRAQLKINKTQIFPQIYKNYETTGEITYSDSAKNVYTQNQVDAARKAIKTHIKNFGAVVATMYIDIAINEGGEFVSDYYDSENNIFCCTENNYATAANHQITIVGWDDNKKAYIVLNSYGEMFGDNGYFYISYDDVRIEETVYGIEDVETLTSDNYDKLYMYDELGNSQTIGTGAPEIYYANVFSRESTDSQEYINQVGLYIANATGVEIYVNPSDGEFNQSKMKLVSSGEILEPGYHVIKLNPSEDTQLTGDKFIVAVKAINQEGALIPLECNLSESKFTFISNFFDTAKANEGESFFSTDGKNWMEINGTRVGLMYQLKNTNVCVRAFTKYSDELKEIAVTGVRLDKTSVTLKEGQTENLTATVLPEDAANKNITWTSSNENVATISNGVITAKKAGTATITVKTEDGNYTATCNVTVEKNKIDVTGITLNKTSDTLKEGKTVTLIATVLPENATNKNVTWSTSDESIAKVSSGVVTAIKAGTAAITVKTEDGNYTATCKITVEKETIKVTGVTLTPNIANLEEGKTLNLTATVLPENATNKNITWTSSNTAVATVTNGVVTGVKAGKATIKVKTVDGNHTATTQVTVTGKETPKVAPTSVVLNATSKTIKVGETFSLTATVLPENATNKNVTWTSADEAVATVSSGIVTAKKAGTTTITVKTEEGNFTATCNVTVESNITNVTGVTLNKTSETLKVGETSTLIATVLPENATNKNVTWISSDETIATVSSGVVTAKKAGTTIITVKTADGNYTATCNVTVESNIVNVTGVTIYNTNVTLKVGGSFGIKAVVLPENATNKNVMWVSSDETVATVLNGVINAKKTGTTTITVKTEDGNFTDSCVITVLESSVVKVESIKLNKEELQMEVSDKATLTVTFNPESPTNTNIKWESSDTKVATVSENGIITAVGKGKAVITATSEDGGHVAKCNITVTKQVEDPDDIYKENPGDTSTSKDPLPNTGFKTIIFLIALIILTSMGYSFIKYRKLNDVK